MKEILQFEVTHLTPHSVDYRQFSAESDSQNPCRTILRTLTLTRAGVTDVLPKQLIVTVEKLES